MRLRSAPCTPTGDTRGRPSQGSAGGLRRAGRDRRVAGARWLRQDSAGVPLRAVGLRELAGAHCWALLAATSVPILPLSHWSCVQTANKRTGVGHEEEKEKSFALHFAIFVIDFSQPVEQL